MSPLRSPQSPVNLYLTVISTSVMFLLLFVARSKLVPDFALTIHVIHLVVTFLYSRSFPTNTLWWALQLASVALMTMLGMWACQWRELQPISFGGKGSSTGQTAQATNGHVEAGRGGNNLGFGRGGSSSDGAGQYELVGMKDEEGEMAR